MIVSSRQVFAVAVRPDSSGGYLSGFKRQGYSKVVFIANLAADPQCGYLDGNVYEIDDLLKYDAPLFRTSHVNCECKFEPLESSKEAEEPAMEPTPVPTSGQTPAAI